MDIIGGGEVTGEKKLFNDEHNYVFFTMGWTEYVLRPVYSGTFYSPDGNGSLRRRGHRQDDNIKMSL